MWHICMLRLIQGTIIVPIEFIVLSTYSGCCFVGLCFKKFFTQKICTKTSVEQKKKVAGLSEHLYQNKCSRDVSNYLLADNQNSLIMSASTV